MLGQVEQRVDDLAHSLGLPRMAPSNPVAARSMRTSHTQMAGRTAQDPQSTIARGITAFADRDWGTAEQCFEVAAASAKESGDVLSEARARSNLANVFCVVDDFEGALEHFREAVKLLRAIHDRQRERLVIPNGVKCCVGLGNFDEAMGLALRALALASNEHERAEAHFLIQNLNAVVSGDMSVEEIQQLLSKPLSAQGQAAPVQSSSTREEPTQSTGSRERERRGYT